MENADPVLAKDTLTSVSEHHSLTAPPFTLSKSVTMRVIHSFVSSLLLSSAAIVSAASSWSFEDATVSVSTKGAGVGGASKDK